MRFYHFVNAFAFLPKGYKHIDTYYELIYNYPVAIVFVSLDEVFIWEDRVI